MKRLKENLRWCWWWTILAVILFFWKKVMENTCNQSIPSLLFAITAKRFPTNKSYPPWKFPKHVTKYLYCAIFSGIQTQIMHMAFKISFPYNTFQMNGISLVCLETCTHLLFACFEFVWDRFLSVYIYRFLIVYRLPLKWDWNLSCTDCFAYFPFSPFAKPLHQLLIVLIWRACHQSSGVFLRSHWNSFQLLEYSKQSTRFQMVISWKRKELPGSVVGKMTISDFVFFGF